MATKSVRIDEALFERIEAHKREDETFSEAIERLIDEYSLLDVAGGYSEEDAARHRELLGRSERAGAEERSDFLERVETDPE